MQKRRASWRPPKRGLKWTRIALAGGATMLLIAIGAAVGLLFSGSQLDRALRLGRLARIPERCTGFKLDGTRGLFSASYFIRFAASERDIDEFVRQSPSLSHLQPELLGPEHMHLPDSERDSQAAVRDHVYYAVDERYAWFKPTVRVKGRRFVIPRDKDASGGEVIIDDDALIVYIRTWRS